MRFGFSAPNSDQRQTSPIQLWAVICKAVWRNSLVCDLISFTLVIKVYFIRVRTFVVGTCDAWCACACWYWPLRHQYWIQETCPLTSEGKCQNAVKLSLKLQNIVGFQNGVGYRTKPCEKFLSKQNSRTESWICLIRVSYKAGIIDMGAMHWVFKPINYRYWKWKRRDKKRHIKIEMIHYNCLHEVPTPSSSKALTSRVRLKDVCFAGFCGSIMQ